MFRVLGLILVLFMFSCSRKDSTLSYDVTLSYASATSAVLINSASPATGNALVDQNGGFAVQDPTGPIRVRLNKTIGSYEYDIYVYYNAASGSVSQVSLSWNLNRVIYSNAFSTSPSGVVVDRLNKTVSFTNTTLNSGLPTTANLNGQFSFQGP